MNLLTRTIGLTALGLGCLMSAEALDHQPQNFVSVMVFLYIIGGTFTIMGGLNLAKAIMGKE